MNKLRYSQIFFDLDGTLIDSIEDITYAINKMRSHFSLPPLESKRLSQIIGKGFVSTTEQVLSLNFPPKKVKIFLREAVGLTLYYYEKIMGEYTDVYPGVKELLAELKMLNAKMAIVTNKERSHAIKILKYLDLDQYFDCIVGGDSTSFRKPSLEPLKYAFKLLPGSKISSPSVMIGDSINDVMCAKNFDIPCILVSYGYSSILDPYDSNISAIIDHFLQLREYLYLKR